MRLRITTPLLILTIILAAALFKIMNRQQPNRDTTARERWLPRYTENLASLGAQPGNPIYIRILKEERLLTLYIKSPQQTTWTEVTNFPILGLSGTLGPKTREGDNQGPEGFYAVTRKLLHPTSQYHLALNIGYPNAYDTARGYTGSYIMIHGKRGSIGCFAMGDPAIEQIYILAEAALNNGQKEIPVHIYPFALTPQNLARHADSPHYTFWHQLQPAWDYFAQHTIPAPITIRDGNYLLDASRNQ